MVMLSGLARRLVKDELLTEEQAQKSLESAKKASVPFPLELINAKLVNGIKIAKAASEEFGTPVMDLKAFEKTHQPKEIVDSKLIRKHHALPLFKRGNRLFVAVSDPTNLHALDEIKFNTGLTTEAILVEADKLHADIEKYLNAEEDTIGDSLGNLDDEGLDGLDIEAVDTNNDNADENEADEAPIVKFVNKVLLDAIKSGASDIHFEPYEKAYRVRFRTDGVLLEVARPPVNLAIRLAARLKVMSQMDIS